MSAMFGCTEHAQQMWVMWRAYSTDSATSVRVRPRVRFMLGFMHSITMSRQNFANCQSFNSYANIEHITRNETGRAQGQIEDFGEAGVHGSPFLLVKGGYAPMRPGSAPEGPC